MTRPEPVTAPARRRGPAWLALAALLAGGPGAASCKGDARGAAPAPEVRAGASASSTALAAAPRVPAGGGSDEIRPVYPIDHQPPLPLAERYCEAVDELPRKRREACCPGMGGVAPTAECVRTLSSALRSGAVALDAAEVDDCAAAAAKETEGCDWVTSTGSPTPAACLGILRGKLEEGALCRSNLECTEGLRCRGLGATRPGKCAPPLPAARMCNVSTDSLAAFTGQDDFDRHHPECAGYCVRRQCTDAVAPGAACAASVECGPGARCVAGKCSSGPPPAPGEACTDACAAGSRCWRGKCVATKAGGEACEDDGECRAHCERADGGKVGTCAGQCPSTLAKPR